MLTAALAIGALFPLGMLHFAGGTAVSADAAPLVVYSVPENAAQAELDMLSVLSKREDLVLVPLIREGRKVNLANYAEAASAALEELGLLENNKQKRAAIVVNTKKRVVRIWNDPSPDKIGAWIENWFAGSSLPIDTLAPDPSKSLKAMPRVEPATNWFDVVKNALKLHFTQSSAIEVKTGLLVLYLSSQGAVDGIYSSRIKAIAELAAGKGIATVGVFSSYFETPLIVSQYAAAQEFKFPVLYDEGNAFADAYRATRTPEVFLLDSHLHVFYTGAIDSSTWETPETTNYLADAIRALAGGKKPNLERTLPFGTLLQREPEK